jgi:chemotaxis protein MotB
MSKRGVAVFGLAAAIAMAGCASDDWQSKYEEQQKLNLDLSAQNDEVKQQRAEQAAKAEQYAAQLKQTDMEAQKLRAANEESVKEKDALRQQLAGAQSPARPEGTAAAPASSAADANAMRELVKQLKTELGKGATDIGVDKNGNIEITLASDVTFAPGSADLNEAGKKSLKSISTLLKGKFAPYQIRVEGHTDATPLQRTKKEYKDNFGLGSARSLAVVRFMENDLSIEPTRLMSASRGEHDPVADDKTEGGRKKNRRVEIVVVIPHDAAISMAK